VSVRTIMSNLFQDQTSRASSGLTLLPVSVPREFDQALGLDSPARWVRLYWESELNEVCYSDGQRTGIGDTQSWKVFCGHPQVAPLLALYGLESEEGIAHDLLLDRQNHRLYVGESEWVENCLSNPKSLALLAQLDGPSTSFLPSVLGAWPALGSSNLSRFIRRMPINKWLLYGVGIMAISFGFVLLHEFFESILDVLDFWDD
jgi:hypothetical protein